MKPLCSADATHRDLGLLTRSLPLLACGCSYHCCSDCGSPAVLGLNRVQKGVSLTRSTAIISTA
jgi:hypothetical protein